MHHYHCLPNLRDASANHHHVISPVQSASLEFSRGGLLIEQEARLVLGLSIGYMDRQFPALFFLLLTGSWRSSNHWYICTGARCYSTNYGSIQTPPRRRKVCLESIFFLSFLLCIFSVHVLYCWCCFSLDVTSSTGPIVVWGCLH